jgi:hypothetical protein
MDKQAKIYVAGHRGMVGSAWCAGWRGRLLERADAQPRRT